MQVHPFPEEVISTLRGFTKVVLAEEAAKDATFNRVYEAYRQFSANNAAWSEISEAAYANALKG